MKKKFFVIHLPRLVATILLMETGLYQFYSFIKTLVRLFSTGPSLHSIVLIIVSLLLAALLLFSAVMMGIPEFYYLKKIVDKKINK